MAEYSFRTGVYRHAPDGPPIFVAAVDVTVEADDEGQAEEMASDKVNEMLATGYFLGEELAPI